MIQKGTYGLSFRLRCYPFTEGKLPLSDPQGGVAGVQLRPPRRGQESTILGGVAQGFSYGHGHGHVSCKNLNNHRAKRGLLLQHRLQHQVE